MNNDLSTRNRRNFPPIYDPGQQYSEERPLYPMGQYLQTPSPVKPEAISQYDPAASKKIFGMPVDRFASLLGTLSTAIAPKSAQGRFGAGMVRMADMMRGERVAQGEQQATEAEARRKTAAQIAKEKRTAAAKERERREKVPSGWEAFYRERIGEGQTAEQIWTDFKKIGGKEPALKTRTGTKTIDGVNYIGLWDNKGNFTPQRKLTKSEEVKRGLKPKALAGKKEISETERRAQRKEIRGLETGATGNAELPESQTLADSFNELSDKSYVLQRIPGTPAEEKTWPRSDIPAIPAEVKRVPISQFKTPDDVMSADWLSDKAKRRLIEKLFSNQFRK